MEYLREKEKRKGRERKIAGIAMFPGASLMGKSGTQEEKKILRTDSRTG